MRTVSPEDNARLLVLALTRGGALQFGEFTLKDGSKSNYFIDFGKVADPNYLYILGCCYATKLWEIGVHRFEVIFGLAYKGIPLAQATSLALWKEYGIAKPYAFNRKEAKDHGEGGVLIGAAVEGQRCVVVDDVFTGGSGKTEAYEILKENGADVPLTVVGVNRSEPGMLTDFISRTSIPVYSIVTAEDVLRGRKQ
ncbi:MAG: orotate phosphoribosyltransferase [Candidatus Colwellbacteria bacterium]|nr:orotate phosphoribosyltransferase [Candidatus Colwellbacteria bacterium]